MARFLTLDTSFLVDLERERRSGGTGPAHRFLQADPGLELGLSVVALGELAEGYGDPGHPVLDAIRRSHRVLEVDEETALTYASITRTLRAGGALIGANDLWIAATSLCHDAPLVTADVEHFRRVDGLRVVSYR
ncbi:MAG: type II toxin-antitoxin system VapC family toxin [Gemmatimonadetes bacterium]|nr:type II toxin-antitoxin system VapC family toxin [Gemmatimonadota bacterium]